MEEKKINVDMNLFKIPHKTQKKRKEGKDGGVSIKNQKRTETLKKKSILKMIREHQEERYKKLFEDKKENKQSDSKENTDNSNFNNDFKEAQKYLQSLINKQGDSVNKTLKNYTNESLLYHPSIQPINSNLTDVTNNITNTQPIGIPLNPSLNNGELILLFSIR